MELQVLILGGTTEGRLLAERLAEIHHVRALLSFAGRTERLVRPSVPHRVGGFGGIDGLTRFLREGGYQALIDATHPFAARISANAVAASALSGVPLLRVQRPPFPAELARSCTWAEHMAEAALAIGEAPRRVLLTIGKQELAAFRGAQQHSYLVRAIDTFDPGLRDARVLCARGPFSLEREHALLLREGIEVLVSKDAGGEATSPKLAAARALSVRTIMVRRPALPSAEEVSSVDEAVQWLTRLHGS
jgi:precorrin-6A/cobalt-precorrin-6A reductase